MKEIEILVQVYDDEKNVLNKLKKYKYEGIKKTKDVYYYDPLRKQLKPDENMQINECCRLRTKNDEVSITYKVDKFDDTGKWLYSDEYETKVDNLKQIELIISNLGLKPLLTIENNKKTFISDEYEIVLESVKELGLFLEVEYCTNEDVDVISIKRKIQEFIDDLELNVSEELNMGKPEMMIRNHNIIIE